MKTSLFDGIMCVIGVVILLVNFIYRADKLGETLSFKMRNVKTAKDGSIQTLLLVISIFLLVFVLRLIHLVTN